MNGTTEALALPAAGSKNVLTAVLRDGAQQLLTQAIEAEVACWIETHKDVVDTDGYRAVVRNGHLPTRSIITGVGAVQVTQPRVHDRRPDDALDDHGQPVERFRSKILPPYLRKTKSIEELIPWLYLKGVSTGDFTEALQARLGPNATGLSATTVTRLMSSWQKNHQAWSKRSLADQQFVYFWADGVHFNIRLEEDRQCILVLMGATAEGKKELIAVADGYRESEQSWRQLLLGCKQRGLTVAPKLTYRQPGCGGLCCWAMETRRRRSSPGLRGRLRLASVTRRLVIFSASQIGPKASRR